MLPARSKFKGSGIVIHEDIEKQYVVQMNRLKTHDKVKDLWFWNSKLYSATKDGKVHHIMHGDYYYFIINVFYQ